MTFNSTCSAPSAAGTSLTRGTSASPTYFDDLFARHDPDLLGLQELAFASEVDQMLAMLPGYEAVYYRSPDTPFTYLP